MTMKTTTFITVSLGVICLMPLAGAKDRPTDKQALLEQLTSDLEAPEELPPALHEATPAEPALEAEPAEPADAAPQPEAELAPVAAVTPQTAPAPAKAEKEAEPAKKKGTPLKKSTPIDRVGEKATTGPGLGYIMVGALLLLLGGLAFWLKKRAARASPLGKHGRMKTLDVHRVGGKHHVALVKVADRILVLGMGEKGLTLLTELEENELGQSTQVTRVADPKEAAPDAGAGSFLARLNSLRDRFQTEPETKDPFQEALEESAPVDELVRLDERAAIRERLEALRRRSA